MDKTELKERSIETTIHTLESILRVSKYKHMTFEEYMQWCIDGGYPPYKADEAVAREAFYEPALEHAIYVMKLYRDGILK